MTINNSIPLTSNQSVISSKDPTNDSIFKPELENMYQEIFSKYFTSLDEAEESNPIKRKHREEDSDENGSFKFPCIVEDDLNFFNSTPLEKLYSFQNSIDCLKDSDMSYDKTIEGLEMLDNALQNNKIYPTTSLTPEEKETDPQNVLTKLIVQNILPRKKTKAVINLEAKETPNGQEKIANLQYQPFLDACPKLKLSQIVEFSIAVLNEIKKEPNGLIEQYLRPFLPENSFVKIVNGKIEFFFGIKKDVVDSKYLPKDTKSTGKTNLRSNIYTVGKILETTLQGSITVELQQLINDMTNPLPHERGTLITNLTELKKIHKMLVKLEN